VTRIFVHIGLQKTGTSYLQNVFWGSVDELREHGVTMVPDSRVSTFWLALDVRERIGAHDPPRVARSLEMLPGQLAAVTTPAALISHETLASAGPAQIRRFLEACEGHEVHVVVTARDMGRQVPSLWQEGLKAGRSESLADYVAGLRAADNRTGLAWRRLDLAGVLRRWAAHVPAERIHVVTVPGPAGPREALLERYCSVLGIRAADVDHEMAGRGNPGLGAPEAELLRRVNERVPERLRRRVPYGEVGKRWLAMRVLASPGSRAARLDGSAAPWCREVAQESVDTVAALGCDVVGDLADLLPDDAVFEDTAEVSDPDLLEAAIRALAVVLEERLEERLEHLAAPAAGPAPGRVRRVVGGVRRRLARPRT
jgi:hypothetical protein